MNSISAGKKIVVAGLGKSGVAASKFLAQQGYDVTATDIDPARQDVAPLLESFGIKTEIGFHNLGTFESADLVVASPGIPLNSEPFQMARSKGIPIRGEMDIACELIKKPVVAITGTNGKTTVTTMVSKMLESSGKKVFTGGNIGTPLISCLEKDIRGKFDVPADVVVVEVSSFQLDTATNFAPDVAVLLNITEDHLNRYPGFKAYEESKWSIFKNQKKDGYAIINSTITDAEARISGIESLICLFNASANPLISNFNSITNLNILNDFKIDMSASTLLGKHNRENMEAAIMASIFAGGTHEGIKKILADFKGLPHRTEYVETINGVNFYDDSKATNTDAVIRAIEAFESNIILIMGGEEKSTDFSVLKPFITPKVKQIVAMGQARSKLKDALYDAGANFNMALSMEDAVRVAFESASYGDTILLSPACASFDMYKSYAHRGEDFVQKVAGLKLKYNEKACNS
ncbi:UDP-N-acetylmuramoylalanine--D-glutamate ligase [Desulfamplus magnetovallimortis]|uniref:UDP-N-acetylmuramoylalanine--D-glutamate ligase n=1 Tax=Desulfamplus magnetovallimortis TaxID=1246637 RepID=A0A1W1HDZ3_9BACT|nr:UDP-N-acetylmuramoyl-L-alanine--D-glutamate ligase [Desulfamplus magnetovallimortis]SLM30690.1 UDP-N-acetylmuramoylalanine--D-glutamate ligase [Desulfamplus magnetovallimortis]